MKYIHLLFILTILSFQIGCVSSAQQLIQPQVKTERKPFLKSSYVIKQPGKTEYRELENGQKYNLRARVVVVDEKIGKYEFRWIGTDGKEKIVAYQRHDAIDAIIEAKVEKDQSGKFLYKYNFKMLPTSPTYFREFIIQTLSADTKPIEPDDKAVNIEDHRFLVLQQSNANPLFADGVWWNYSFVGKKEERIWGGKTIEFQLLSSGLPGIVNCKATGGEIATKGVGQEIPQVLEDEIPIFEDLAHGYTIGPVESLAGLSKSERAKYLLDNLPRFQEAGWIAASTAKKYESILKREDLLAAFEQAKKDFENEYITIEVFQIIDELKK